MAGLDSLPCHLPLLGCWVGNARCDSPVLTTAMREPWGGLPAWAKGPKRQAPCTPRAGDKRISTCEFSRLYIHVLWETQQKYIFKHVWESV